MEKHRRQNNRSRKLQLRDDINKQDSKLSLLVVGNPLVGKDTITEK